MYWVTYGNMQWQFLGAIMFLHFSYFCDVLCSSVSVMGYGAVSGSGFCRGSQCLHFVRTPESPWLSGIQMCAMVIWPGHMFVSEHVYMCSFICVLGTRECGAQHGCDKDGTWVWQWHRTNAKWIWVSYCQTGRFICPIMHYEDCIKGELPHVCYREGWSVWVRAYRSCQCFCCGFGQATLLGFRC